MTKPKLTYFDSPASRGEECRLALLLAGVDYEDVRLSREAWAAYKPKTPFGSVPTWEEPGRPVLAQSNPILTLIGRRHGLHPKDDFEAARHEALMEAVEDLRNTVTPTLRIKDEAEKKAARDKLATEYLPTWGAFIEKQLGEGPFLAGSTISVADIKLYMAVRWFARGTVDRVPATVFAPFARLSRLHDAVAQHPKLKDWIAKN